MINNQGESKDTISKVEGIRLRIRKFIMEVIRFAKEIPKDELGKVFVNQLLRSATSIGANYEESSESQTNKDVVYKLSVVKKEAKETRYWISLVGEAYNEMNKRGLILMQENLELIRIFSSIISRRRD